MIDLAEHQRTLMRLKFGTIDNVTGQSHTFSLVPFFYRMQSNQ